VNIRLIKAKPAESQLFDENLRPRLTGEESRDRITIQRWIELNNFRPAVLYDGNTVIRKDKIIREFKRLLGRGTLDGMSDYFYKFLHLDAGSSAHYDKRGWIHSYDNSAEALCDFFLCNEYGHSVLSEQPHWKTDCVEIARTLLRMVAEHRGEPLAA